MATTLANAEPVLLMSLFKPLVMAVALLGWARLVNLLDADLVSLSAPRELWNSVQLGAGIVAFGLWLTIPIFWVGSLVALLAIGAATGSYTFFRNNKVPISAKWTPRTILANRQEGTSQPIGVSSPTRSLVTFIDPDNHALSVPTSQDRFSMAHHTIEILLNGAIKQHAEQIHIKTNADAATVTTQIDGMIYPETSFDPSEAVAVIDYLKHCGGLDLSDRRRRASSKLKVYGNEQHRTLALTTFGTLRGLEMTIDIDPDRHAQFSLDQLGLMDSQIAQLTSALTKPNGLVLVSSPPGHGQTTTLYSLLKQHDPYIESIATLEEQVATEIEGVSHRVIWPTANALEIREHATKLLRQNHQVVMFSQLPDTGIANLITESAMETRIYLGIRQRDTFDALRQWIKTVGDAHATAETITAVIAGQLLRKLCPTCRVPYKPSSETMRKINIATDRIDRLYKHSGHTPRGLLEKPCEDCGGLGYRGRVGVFEVMVVDDEARQLIADDQLLRLRSHLRDQQKMIWLQEAALAKVTEGVTSISELTRVLDRHSLRTKKT